MIYLGFLILCVVPFLPSFPGPVRLWDDQASIVARKPMFDQTQGWRGMHWIWTSQRPVYELTNYVNYRLSGQIFWPARWHAINCLLHWAAVCSLFHVMTRLDWSHPAWIAAAFAVHPMQTASVAYVSGRSGILAALFLFLGVTVYLWPFPFDLLSPIPFFLAFMSRQDAIVGLAWLPFLEYYR